MAGDFRWILSNEAPRRKRCIVRLSDEERGRLIGIVKKFKGSSQKVRRAQILLKADAEFVAGMEEVLDTYAQPYDPACPALCMDEQPVQLLKETRTPIPATADHGKRIDYEYERAGMANIFMFTEPLAGWREVSVRQTKTKADWAMEMGSLLEGRYAACEQVIVVCDNLNTHTQGAFDEVFDPERARRLVRRLEFRYTPGTLGSDLAR